MRKSYCSLIFVMLLLLISCNSNNETIEKNKAIIKNYFELMDKGDQSFLDLLSPNYVVHFTGGMDVHGPEEIKNLVDVFKKALPDFRHDFKDFIAEGNKVALRYSGMGTHMNEFMGIQPSKMEVNITAIGIIQIENGKMIEGWIECDMITPLKNALAESEKTTQ